jgi:hypothetical protein
MGSCSRHASRFYGKVAGSSQSRKSRPTPINSGLKSLKVGAGAIAAKPLNRQFSVKSP